MTAVHNAADHLPGSRRKWLKRLFILALLAIVALLALAITSENHRGKRAWEQYRRELEARGEKFEWQAFAPPPVPDDQDVFKAPKMTEWFVGKGDNDLTERLNGFSRRYNTDAVAEVTIAPANTRVASGDANVVLQYKYHALSLAPPPEDSPKPSEPESSIIPCIQFQDVPLLNGIDNLARQAGLKYVLDPRVNLRPDRPQPEITIRWENLTAEQALIALLNNYGLQLINDRKAGILRITQKNDPRVYADTLVQERMGKLFQSAINSRDDDSPGSSASGAQGLTLVAKPLNSFKAVRVFVQSDEMVTAEEVEAFFPQEVVASALPGAGRLWIKPAGNNSFQVLPANPPYAAADYLKWSDQFEAEFDLMREALKRPYARIEVDYQRPFAVPFQNFYTIRLVAQTLAQRAQCHLLLGQPELALRELTLIHRLRRLLEGRPPSQPMTIVAAMINVAVTGLYVEAVTDGMRLRAWREPELAAIQDQLKEINLPPIVAAGLEYERAVICHLFETGSPAEVEKIFFYPANPKTNLWQKIKSPIYQLFTFAPRSWVYQNITAFAGLGQKLIDMFDRPRGVIMPRKHDEFSRELGEIVAHPSRRTFLAAMAAPNFLRGVQTTARNQTLANEALIVCALERHRLARDQYPETLDELVPRFAEKLPPDVIGGLPLKYRRIEDGQFVLYSVGWNETDDGGIAVRRENSGNPGIEERDWIWRPSAN